MVKRGKKTIQTDISFPASKVWQVYSTLELPEIIKTIPNYVKALKVTGDGSAGITYYDIWNLPGSPFEWYKEKVTRLDQDELIKEVDVVEGGVLNFGYTFFRTKFEILRKGASQCTVRSSVMYEIEDQYAENEKMASADDLATIAQAVEEYLKKKGGVKRGKKTIETDISFSASKVWQVYSTLELPEIIKTIPNYVKDLKVTGDGSVGITYYDIWNLPGAPFEWYKEKVTRLDQDELIKEVDVVEGGVLNFGYTFFRTKFEILRKGVSQCTVRSSVMYEIENQYAGNEKMASADDLATIAQAVEEYLRKKVGGGSVLGAADGSTPVFNTGGLPG